MDHLLAWQNIIFYIPLAVGVLLVFGSAFGGGNDTGADADADHDVGQGGHDGGQDHGALDVAKALSMLGVGRVPLIVVLMMASLIFGGVGIITNRILSSFGVAPWLHGSIAIAAAFVGMLSLTGAAAKLLNRILPTSQTYRVSRRDFAGCTGTLLLPADPASGYAQVKDHEGNVHNIKCRTARGVLPKGGQILVVEYEEETQTYVVDANPTETKSSATEP